MKSTQQLHDLGQSLWLDNITRGVLTRRHIAALHQRAVGDRVDVQSHDFLSRDLEKGDLYDDSIRRCSPKAYRARRCSFVWRSRI